MEWVETTARTVEEAKERALDQLGVAEDDAEFEVLDEPRAGLFGRVRGEARVRARVRPTQPRPKAERRERRPKTTGADGADDSVSATESGSVATSSDDGLTAAPRRHDGPRPERNGPRRERTVRAAAGNRVPKGDAVDAEQVGEEARRFVQGLVEAFGLEGTAGVRRDGDDLEVTVDGSDLGLLVGPRGSTLQAVQEITRVAAQRRLGDHDTRLRVDVGGYR